MVLTFYITAKTFKILGVVKGFLMLLKILYDHTDCICLNKTVILLNIVVI